MNNLHRISSKSIFWESGRAMTICATKHHYWCRNISRLEKSRKFNYKPSIATAIIAGKSWIVFCSPIIISLIFCIQWFSALVHSSLNFDLEALK